MNINEQLLRVCGNGDIISVIELLKHKDINVNYQNKCGHTALIIASIIDYLETVKELLKHKDIDVEVKDKWGKTALTKATLYGNTKTEKLLRDHIESIKV